MKNGLHIFATTAMLLAFGNVASLYAQHNHGSQPNPQMDDRAMTMTPAQDKTLKVGKRGAITLDAETQVGELLLKPGRYTLQHHVDGADHVLRFVTQSGKNAGEVKCKLEPFEGKVPQTLVRLQNAGASKRLVQVQIAGENVTHVL